MTTAEEIDALVIRRKQLTARIKKLEAAKRAKERKQDMRRKILVGSYFLSVADQRGGLEYLSKEMDAFLTRDSDRALFGLPSICESSQPTETVE